MSSFVPALELARSLYEQVIAALLADTRHSAALLGTGSDVLGYDTERSTDHGWGPRLEVFVQAVDLSRVRHVVEENLPDQFGGWPTRYGWDDVPVTHHIGVSALDEWLRARLGFDPLGAIATRDWLSVPQQVLLEVTRGAVFHDGIGDLTAARERLAWYPDQVWLWLLACQWRRLDQEEPFVGRTAEVGDDLGSRILVARLVRDVVRMSFLQERRYAPYGKWLGSAFRELDAYGPLGRPLLELLAARDYGAREALLVDVVQTLAARHNALGLTAPVDERVGLFYDRPFRVLGSGRFVDACLEGVSDPLLRSLPLTGAVDQFVDSTDVLSNPSVFPRTASLFDQWIEVAESL